MGIQKGLGHCSLSDYFIFPGKLTNPHFINILIGKNNKKYEINIGILFHLKIRTVYQHKIKFHRKLGPQILYVLMKSSYLLYFLPFHHPHRLLIENMWFWPWPSGSVGWSIFPVCRKDMGSFPGQDTCIGCGFVPSWGTYERQLINVSLSHQCFFLSLSQINIHILGWG